MKRTGIRIIATLMVLATSLLFASAGIAAERAWLMSTSGAGTAGYACTMGLSSLVAKHTKYKLEAVPTPGSTASVRLFGKKECDFAYQSGWGLSEIYEKYGPFEKVSLPRNPYQGLYYASFEIMAMTKADRKDINSYKDFVGKKVFPNPAAMGWHDLVKVTLDKMGIYQKLEARQLDVMQAGDALKIGNLDVVIGYSTNLGELSVSWVKNIDSLTDMKVVSPSPEEQKQISAMKLPGVFYGEKMSYKALTPANVDFTKKANPDGIWLFGSYQGWHPGADMPTEVMYQMYKAWMEYATEIANVNAYLEYWSKDPVGMQVKAIDTAPGIPVHPGVAKYLKEKGLWKSNWTIGKLDAGVE
jgi:TRAP transporter TAXI family solute receptor